MKHPLNDYIYQITDFFTSTELIPRRRLPKWINRPGFAIRKVVILKWIVLGNILTLGYKTTLLSSLIPIRYGPAIDSMADLDRSGLPLILAEGGSSLDYVCGDSREMMIRICNRRIVFSMKAKVPRWIFEM